MPLRMPTRSGSGRYRNSRCITAIKMTSRPCMLTACADPIRALMALIAGTRIAMRFCFPAGCPSSHIRLAAHGAGCANSSQNSRLTNHSRLLLWRKSWPTAACLSILAAAFGELVNFQNLTKQSQKARAEFGR